MSIRHTVSTFNRLFTENVGPIDDHRALYLKAYKRYYGYPAIEAEVPVYTISRSKIARCYLSNPYLQPEISKLPKNVIGRIVNSEV